MTPTLSGPKTMVFVMSEGGNLSGNISASFRTITRQQTRQSLTHLRHNKQQVLWFPKKDVTLQKLLQFTLNHHGKKKLILPRHSFLTYLTFFPVAKHKCHVAKLAK